MEERYMAGGRPLLGNWDWMGAVIADCGEVGTKGSMLVKGKSPGRIASAVSHGC